MTHITKGKAKTKKSEINDHVLCKEIKYQWNKLGPENVLLLSVELETQSINKSGITFKDITDIECYCE